MEKQSIISQKGEIEFRKKLISQQVHGNSIFKDEYNGPDIEKIMIERMERTFQQIKKKGVR